MKIYGTIILNLFYFGLYAQSKIFIIPKIGFIFSSFKGVDSINNKQNLLETKPFTRKDLAVGISIKYLRKNFSVSMGLETGVYASGYYYDKEPKNVFPRIESKETSAEGNGPLVISLDVHYEPRQNFSLKKPKWVFKNSENEYLSTYKLSPFVGFEARKMQKTFINDFTEYNSVIGTNIYGDIYGSSTFHLNKQIHFLLRTGFDLILFKDNNRKLTLTIMYQLGFKEAGYWLYHFSKPTRGIDFYYQTTTRGNGLSIKAGFPIKMLSVKK